MSSDDYKELLAREFFALVAWVALYGTDPSDSWVHETVRRLNHACEVLGNGVRYRWDREKGRIVVDA